MIGLGYIGLPTAAIIASRGVKVIGVDNNPHVVDTINSGKIHIVEPDLDIVVHSAVQTGMLRAFPKPQSADAFLIAVPTPFSADNKPDLSYIRSAASSVASVLKKGDLVILESTSPVGTTDQLAQWLASARPDLTFPHSAGEDADVNIAYCPERVLPGKVLYELMANDRVIGGMTKTCAERAKALYSLFLRGNCVLTNARTAEMCKLTENSFRDVNIAFANELSLICDKFGIDVWELISLANRHPRVNILQPGPGVGGHCIAVDPWFIVDSAPKEARLIAMARHVNDSKPEWVVSKLKQMVAEIGKPKVSVSCFGLAFKADIDDLRESPALDIVRVLAREPNVQVLAHEPNIQELPAYCSKDAISLVPFERAISEADIAVLLVDHQQYKTFDWTKMGFPILDTKGILPLELRTQERQVKEVPLQSKVV